MRTGLGVCHVPSEHQSWEEPEPTVTSWKAAAAIGISHLRLNYNLAQLKVFEPAFRAAHDGGMHITPNMGVPDMDAAKPAEIETAAFDLAQHYGPNAASLSFENEQGMKPGMQPSAPVPDISQGGTFDWIKSVYGPLVLAFMRGVRRANHSILIDLFDSDSTDVQERSMALLIGTEFENDPRIRWCAHNYADVGGDASRPEEPAGQDYSSMAGMNGKPGFLSVFTDPRFGVTIEAPPPPPGAGKSGGFTNINLPRDWYISEIGKTTGPYGGIATPSDMQVMLRYARMMLSKYPQCRIIDFLSPEFFFTRVKVQEWLNPAPTFSTFRFGDPVVSADGQQLAGLFTNGPIDPVKTTMPVRRKRAVRPS